MQPISKTFDASPNDHPNQPNTSSYVLQTVNLNVGINSFSCPTDKLVTETFTLLHPYVEIAPINDPFIILTHTFEEYQSLQYLLQLHTNDIHALTLSTIHVNDFLNTLVLLETPPSFTKFVYRINLPFALCSRSNHPRKSY